MFCGPSKLRLSHIEDSLTYSMMIDLIEYHIYAPNLFFTTEKNSLLIFDVSAIYVWVFIPMCFVNLQISFENRKMFVH